MPIETALLHDAPKLIAECPNCDALFVAFMRGQVQRAKRTLFSWPPFKRRGYCALICSVCKEIVGWESPKTCFRCGKVVRVSAGGMLMAPDGSRSHDCAEDWMVEHGYGPSSDLTEERT